MAKAPKPKDWATRGYSCGLCIDPPEQTWEDFVHAEDELVMLSEGEFEIQERTFRLAPGEEVFIPAGAVHSVRDVGGTTARWSYGWRRDAG